MKPMKKVGIYAGTFDPFTNGHLAILDRALDFLDEVILLVSVHGQKSPLLTVSQRVMMCRDLFKDRPRVIVDSWEGLTVDYARKHNVKLLLRGLRPTGDFENEIQMAALNRSLNPEVDTIFLTTEHYFVSSSLVREVLAYGSDIAKFVPEVIVRHLLDLKKNK